MTFLLLLFAISFGLIGDTFLKQYGIKNLIIGTILWTCGAFPTAKLLKKMDFSILGIYWSCLSIILTLIMGIMLYQETLTFKKGLAVVFAIIATILAGL